MNLEKETEKIGKFSEEWYVKHRYFTDKESMYNYMKDKRRTIIGYWEENGIIWVTYREEYINEI